MRSYPLLIDGRDREGQGWNYTVRASALLADPVATFNLKRALDLGQMSPEDASPSKHRLLQVGRLMKWTATS